MKHRALLLLILAVLVLPKNVSATDCNQNGVGDDVDISTGASADCNANGIPDECDVSPQGISFNPTVGSVALPNLSGDPAAPVYQAPEVGPITTGGGSYIAPRSLSYGVVNGVLKVFVYDQNFYFNSGRLLSASARASR